MHPEDRERVKDIFGQHLKTGEDYRLVHRIITPAGIVRTVHARSITTLGEEGKPIRSFGVIGDISEIKAAEKALIESERENRMLFETMSQGVIYYDQHGVATKVNPACLKILGLTEEQVLEFGSFQNKWTLVKPDGKPYAEDEDRVVFQAIRTKKSIENKTIGLLDKETQKCIWLMVSVVPEFRDGEEIPFQVFATFTDITNQKRAEEALSDSELRYRSIFEVSPVGIAILQHQQIVFINPAGMNMLGIKSNRELFEKSAFSFIRPDCLEKAMRLSTGLQVGEKGLFPTEITLLDANGGSFDVEISASFLQYNHAPAFQVIATDITERKKYLRATEAQNKILKDIAWTQSHVVRAPLATMMGLVNLLEMEDYTAFSHRDIMGLISVKANELDQVIRNISDKAFTVSMIEMENEETLPVHPAAEDVFSQELLLVDDDLLMQKLHISIAIRNKLHPEPKSFMNGKTALDFILSHNTTNHLHLVWLDINMPVMNGWEFLDSINRQPLKCSVHVMILSSSVDMADRIKAQQYPQVIDYFTKPITRHTVQSMLTHPKLKGIWK